MILSKKIAIDLGTSNSLVYVLKKGIIFNEPTVVAVTAEGEKVVAIGKQAKEMTGRTPEDLLTTKPLREGVIADYFITEAMLKYFINKICGPFWLLKPEVMLSAPMGVTSVEARAVLDAAFSAGAKSAYLVPQSLAAALGAKIPIFDASGSMIVNSGGGITEISVISLGGLVVTNSVRTGGEKIDEAIVSYIRYKHNLYIGEKMAEVLKLALGNTFYEEKKALEIKGRDSITGLPRMISISSQEITESMQETLGQIVEGIKKVLEQTPPELLSDIMDKGVILSGGNALLKNFDKFLTEKIGVPFYLAEEPQFCVIKGVSHALENLDKFKRNIIRVE